MTNGSRQLDQTAISGEQCAAARAWLRLGMTELAAELRTTRATLRRFEAGENIPRKATLAALREFFEERGIVFVWSPEGFPEGILASMRAWRIDYEELKQRRARHSRRAVLRRAKERPAIWPNLVKPTAPLAAAATPAPAPNRASPADRERLAALEAEERRIMAEIAAAQRAAQATKGGDDDDEF